jgi:hypothetical protein
MQQSRDEQSKLGFFDFSGDAGGQLVQMEDGSSGPTRGPRSEGYQVGPS